MPNIASPPDGTGLHTLPDTFDQLRHLDDILREAGVDRVSLDDRELFSLPDRMLRLDDDAILVFRYEDLRRLGPNPVLGNVPTDVFIGQFFAGLPEDLVGTKHSETIRRFQRNQVFTSQPDTHRIMKPILSKPLAAGAMPPFGKMAEEIAASLLKDVLGTGEIDFLEDFAQPFAFAFWGRILDMNAAETERLRGAMAGMAANSSRQHRTKQGLLDYCQSVQDYLDILVEAIKRARLTAKNPFLNWRVEQFAAMAARPAGFPDDIDVSLAVDLFDGFHALGTAIANCLQALLGSPGAYAETRKDPGLIPGAVAEGVRLYAPVRLIARWVQADMVYEDMRIPAHTTVVMYWGGGNRDPSVFRDPNRYDLARNHALTTTFGAGAQICPGRNLVRTLAVAVLQQIVRQHIAIRPVGDAEWLLDKPLTNELRLPSYPVTMTVDRA